jgi:hypothetical protein
MPDNASSRPAPSRPHTDPELAGADTEGLDTDVSGTDVSATYESDSVGPEDADPARRERRAEIGKYVSLTPFPTTVETLIHDASANRAPDFVISALRSVRPGTALPTTRELWIELGLEATDRF